MSLPVSSSGGSTGVSVMTGNPILWEDADGWETTLFIGSWETEGTFSGDMPRRRYSK